MSARSPLAPETAPEGINFGQYVGVILRRKRLIGICVLVGILLAGAYTLLAPKSYRSKAVVEVQPTVDPPSRARQAVKPRGVPRASRSSPPSSSVAW